MEEITVKVKDEKPKKTFTEEDIQQKIIVYQLLERQAEALKEQMIMVEQRMLEVKSTREAVDGMKSEESDIMIPIGSGVYKTGSLKGKKLIVDIGSGIMLTKDKTSVSKYIQDALAELEKGHGQVEKQFMSVIEKLNETALDIQEMSRQNQQ